MPSQEEGEGEEEARRPLRQLDVRLVRIDRKLRLDGRGSLRLLPEEGGQVAVVAKYLSYIYLGSSVCLSSCHPLLCSAESNGTVSCKKKIMKIVITLK